MTERDETSKLARLLDAWEALCAAAGRRSLWARDALTAGTPAQREALARALVGLGKPEATRSAHALGAALRGLRGREDARGRALGVSHGARGAIWYVEPGDDPQGPRELAGGAGAAGGEEVGGG